MALFPNLPPSKNLLPYDGKVVYYGKVMPSSQADLFFDKLWGEIDWQPDKAVIFGKTILTKRKVAWYGDAFFSYTYSHVTKTASRWTETLMALKQLVEREVGESFNSCLLNLYHDGSEGMAWHSDGEKELEKYGTVASLSLGATRKFCFKHKKTKEKVCLDLSHGSLLLMQENTQENWWHRLPPTKKVLTPRINLTFRRIVAPQSG